MAKLPTMKAVIEIDASTEEAERKLTELEKIAKKIEKDGTAFKIEADESGMIQVKKIIDEIKADSKNKISFLELDESMHSMLVKYEKELKSTGEAVRKMFSDLMNGAKNVDIGGIVKGISPELDEINKKIKEQTALIEERNKVMADAKQKALQFQQIEKDSAKRIQDSYRKYVLENKSDDRNKFAAEFKSYLDNDFNHSYLTHKGTGGESFDFEKYKQKYENILKRLPKSFNLDREAAKISSGLNLPFSKDQHREYAKSFNTIKAEVEGLTSSLKELEAQKLKTEKQIELDRINKENLLNKNKLNDPKDLEEKIVSIKVDPESLDKFYQNIEQYRHAKIIVEPELAEGFNLEIDKDKLKNVEIAEKENSTSEDTKKDLVSKTSIISEINKILGSGAQNGFKDQDYYNLDALMSQYRNVIGSFTDKNLAKLLEEWRIDIDEFTKGWNSAKKKLEDSKKNINKIKDDVKKDNSSEDKKVDTDEFKGIYNEIKSKEKSHYKEKIDVLGANINKIIKEAIDSGNPLNDEQAKELVAMVEIWKNRKNTDGRSPIGSILKGYGVSKDNNLLGNYDTFKGQYEDYIKYLSEESKKNPPIIKPKVDTTDAKKDIDKLNEVIENGSKQQENSNLTENITDPIKKEAVIYKQIIADIENIISLQDRVNKGNRLLTDITSPNSLVDKSDTRGGYTTKKSIEKLLAKYDAIRSDNISAGLDGEHGLDKLKEKMVAYVALYKDITSAQKIFGKKHEYLWADPNNKGVGQQAGRAINSNIAYNKQLELTERLLKNIFQLQGKTDKIDSNDLNNFLSVTGGNKKNLVDFLKDGYGYDILAEKERLGSLLNANNGNSVTIPLSGDIESLIKSLQNQRGQLTPIEIPLKADIESLSNSIKEQKNQIAAIEVKLKANIDSLNDSIKSQKANVQPIPIDAKLKNVKGVSEGENLNFDGLKQSISELVLEINKVENSLDNVNNQFLEASVKQISSVDSIAASVVNLKEKLTEVGATSLTEITHILPETTQEDLQKLQKAREELTSEQNKFLEEQNKFKTEKEKFDKQKQKEEKVPITAEYLDEATRKLIEAGELTDDFVLDPKSISFSEKGYASITAVINDLGETATQVTYEIDNLNKAIINGSFDKDYLSKHLKGKTKVVQGNAEKLYAQQAEQIKTAFKSIGGLDEKSLKIDASGISFIREIKDAEKGIVRIKHEAKSLDEIFTKSGAVSKRFLKKGVNLTDGDGVNKKTEELLKAIDARRKIGDTYGADNKGEKVLELLNKEKAIEAELQALIEKTNLSLEERAAIQERINQARNKNVKDIEGAFTAGDKESETLEKLESNYVKAVDSLKDKDFIGAKGLDDKETVFASISRLQDTASKAMQSLRSETFESKEEFERLVKVVQESIDKINELNNKQNYVSYTKGNKQFSFKNSFLYDGDLSDLDRRSAEDYIKQALGGQYEKINFTGTYNKNTQQVPVELINGDRLTRTTVQLRQYTDAMNRSAIAVDVAAGSEKKYLTYSQKWMSGLKDKISNLTQYVTGIELVMRAWNKAREGFNFVKELDTSMTTIYETMDITRSELAELSAQSIKTAKDLGAVADQMIDSVNIYAAYGKTVDEMLKQATPTVMLANATQGSAEEASDFIQGVIQQYKELEGQETRIVNAYEKIGSLVQIDFPKAVQGMAAGVQVAGSVMREAGVDFELYAASLSKVMEVTRSDGSQIANAMKTIAARISRAKTGDEEATAEERSNASKAYGSVGIDVYNQDGSYRGLNNILDELADKWDTLTDAQKNYIAEQSAGVRNINVFNTMLDTWGEAQEIANAAIEDSGYYLEVQEKHMESMQAKLNQLQAQWQEFWYNLIDTNAVNLVIDFLQNLVKLASAVVDGFSAIGSVFGETGGAIGGIAGAIGIVLTAASAWTSFQKGLKDSEGGVFKRTFAGFSGMFEDIKKLGTTAKTTFDIFKSGMSDGVDGTKGLIGGIKAVTNTLTKTELAFLKVGLAIAAIGVAVKVFDVLTISSEEAAENAKKVAEEYQKVQKTLNDNKKVIDSVSDEYQILSEGVDLSNNKNISLTTDEYNRYLDICNQIADIYPSLVQSYDEQGNAILKLKGKVSALNEEYEKERLNAARTNANNLGEYTEDFKNKTGNRSGFTYFADSWNDWGDADVGGRLTEGDAARILENVSNMTLEEFNAHLKDLGSRKQSDASAGDELSYLLGDDVLNIGFWDRMGGLVQVTEDQFKSMRQKISSLIPGYAATVNDSAAQVKSAMQSLLLTMQLDEETYGDFINLDSNVFNQISGMFNNMTSEQIEELFGDSEDIEFAIKTYMYDFVKAINDTPDAQVGLSNLLNIDDDATIEEMAKVISDNLPSLAKLLGYEGEGEIAQLVEQLGLTETKELVDGFDEDVEDINKSLNKTNKENKEQVKYHEKIKKFIKDEKINTKSELALLKQCASTSETWAETMHNFSLTNIDVNINDEELSNLKSNLIIVNETIDKIDEATQASYSSKGLTSEQIENIKSAFSDLKDEAGKALFDYDKLFESSAEGVRLNAQELDRLNGLYEEAERNKYDKKLEELQDQYARTCIAIDKAVTSTEKYELINRRDYLLKQIQQAQELKSQYEGLTNAVTKYQRAKELGEEGDTYLSLVEDKETIEELYNNGEVGTNQFKAAVQMMTNKAMSGASVAEYLDVYKTKWAQFSSWLTEDASGLQTFLYDLKDLGMASVDENGFWSIDGDIEEMANGLGTSQAIIQEIFKRLKDFGFDVDFREETDHLKALREEAEKLREGVSEEYKLDLTVKGEDAIDAQIKKGEELLKGLDSESEAYKSLRTQVNYLRAVAGQTADALNFKLNYNDNKDEIDGLITKLKSIEAYKDIYINFQNVNITNVDGQIDNVTSKLDALRDPETGKINFSAPGATELSDILIALNNKKIELSSTSAILKLDSNNFEEGYSSAITQIKDVKANMDELARTEVEIELGVEGAEEKAETLKSTIQTQLDEINKGENKVLVDLGMSNVTQENFQTLLDGITANKLVDVEFPLTEEDKATLGYIESDITKEIDGDFTKINQKLAELDKDISRVRTITFQASGLTNLENRVNAIRSSLYNINAGVSGGVSVNGTAHAQGTAHSTLLQKGLAFAKGTWGAAKSGMSLVGELGREIIVRGNRFFTVGDNGAEMFPVKKGDIIFNHKQSRELLEHGYVTSGNGRGDMVGGDAFAQGTAYNAGVSGSFTTAGALQGANKFYNDAITFASGEGMDEDEFKEVMDWVEIMIDRLERKIEDLDTVASSSYKKWITRNKTLVSEFGKVTEEIELQQKAYNTYLARAESVALSEEYKQKIRDGKLQIEDITDEDLKEKIDDFSEWYEKALNCSYAITDLKEQLAELVETKFNNVVDEFDALISVIEHTTDSIDTALSIVEAKGQFASETYFRNLMSTEKENISMLQREYAALLAEFDDAMKTGTIQEGSEAWYDMKEQIRDVESALQDANLALIEYRNDMWEMDWSVFEKQLEYIEEITKESEFLVNLLSHNENDLFGEKNGKLTDQGFAVGGLHAMDYNVYMAEAQKYADKVKEINAELAKDPTNTILLDKKNEYLEAQREAISNANDEKLAIRDLIEESYNRMLEILQELIDKRKEALQAEKDLYSYEKDVREQTKQITDYQKQLKALQGDDSEETKSRRQQLQESLEDAQSNLEETEYDRWLSDQEQLMDEMYTQFEEVLNERLDDIDGLLQRMIDETNGNLETIGTTINTASDKVGYTLTEGMQDIWDTTDSGLGKVVSEFNNNFMSTLTTTNEYINKIYKLINKNVENADKDYDANTTPAAGITPSASSSSASMSSGSSSSSGSSPSSSSSSSASSNKGSFFKHKTDYYPKSKLNINTSIVDVSPPYYYIGQKLTKLTGTSL